MSLVDVSNSNNENNTLGDEEMRRCGGWFESLWALGVAEQVADKVEPGATRMIVDRGV